MKKIVILGTGGSAIDILDTLNDINRVASSQVYQCAGLLDDREENWGKELYGAKVLGPLNSAGRYGDCFFVNGIGSPGNFWNKDAIIRQTALPDGRFETIVHPTASVSTTATLGPGSVVFQNATLTSHVRTGRHVIILPNAVISHDVVLGDYTCVTAGVCISGGVTIGQACYLGTNASIHGNVTIGDYCLIGMGSVVLSDVPDDSVVAGAPARFLRKTRPPTR